MKYKNDPEGELSESILGTGTKLQATNAIALLDAHEEDIVFLSEANGILYITVGDTTIELNEFESQNLVIRSNPASVVADDTVKIPVKGLFHRPPDHPKSTSKSAGLVFRGLYQKWLLNKAFKPKKS